MLAGVTLIGWSVAARFCPGDDSRFQKQTVCSKAAPTMKPMRLYFLHDTDKSAGPRVEFQGISHLEVLLQSHPPNARVSSVNVVRADAIEMLRRVSRVCVGEFVVAWQDFRRRANRGPGRDWGVGT